MAGIVIVEQRCAAPTVAQKYKHSGRWKIAHSENLQWNVADKDNLSSRQYKVICIDELLIWKICGADFTELQTAKQCTPSRIIL